MELHLPCTIYILSKKEYCELDVKSFVCVMMHTILLKHGKKFRGWNVFKLSYIMPLQNMYLCILSTFEEVCLLCIKRTVIQDNNMNLIEIQIPNVRKAGATYTHQGA